MKIILDYAPETGELTDNGVFVTNVGTNYPFTDSANATSEGEAKSKTKDLVSLKDAGFSADEIMQMKREGLI